MKKIYKGIFDKYINQSDIYDNYDKNLWEIKENYKIPLDIEDLIDNFSTEDIIDAIGLDKVEMILRKKKLQKLKSKIK